jgi:hypothetical protein
VRRLLQQSEPAIIAAMVVGTVPSIATTIHGALRILAQFLAPASSSSAFFDGREDSSANRRRKMQPSLAGSMAPLSTTVPQQ